MKSDHQSSKGITEFSTPAIKRRSFLKGTAALGLLSAGASFPAFAASKKGPLLKNEWVK